MKLAEYQIRFVPRTQKIEDKLTDKEYDQAIEILDEMHLRFALEKFMITFFKEYKYPSDADFLRRYFRVEVENE